MSRMAWLEDPLPNVRLFEARHGLAEAGALLCWAVWTVDSLYYLADIDAEYAASGGVVGGHEPAVVDVAHARWITVSCMSAIDLCAAALGRTYCGNAGPFEYNLGSFAGEPPSKQSDSRRAMLPPRALEWVDSATQDHRFATLKLARNALTHARLSRHFKLGPGGPSRLRLEIGSQMLEVMELVDIAKHFGGDSVQRLISALPDLDVAA